jgi:hypothetical protein
MIENREEKIENREETRETEELYNFDTLILCNSVAQKLCHFESL